jgi:hypothetical protein
MVDITLSFTTSKSDHITQLCHLLEAQVDVSSPGLYDNISRGTLQEKTQAIRTAMASDFGLHELPFYTDDERSRALLPSEEILSSLSIEYWGDRLDRKGVDFADIEFLCQILNPLPAERWTAGEIAHCGYLGTRQS